jgi:hypothetical protein
MEKVMADNYNPSGHTMNITDLANACKTQTTQQVDEQFIKAASYILTAHVGDTSKELESKGKTGKALAKKSSLAAKKKALWDTSKFAVD